MASKSSNKKVTRKIELDEFCKTINQTAARCSPITAQNLKNGSGVNLPGSFLYVSWYAGRKFDKKELDGEIYLKKGFMPKNL